MLRLTLRAAIKARYVSRKATHEHKRPGYAPHERSRATDVGLRQTRHFITVRHDKKCRALAFREKATQRPPLSGAFPSSASSCSLEYARFYRRFSLRTHTNPRAVATAAADSTTGVVEKN